MNLNLQLSELLKDIPYKNRARKVFPIVKDIIKNTGHTNVCLDHIEILFDPSLKQDPIKLLQDISRNYILIASWKGKYENQRLFYAQPDHSEYYYCDHFEGTVIQEELIKGGKKGEVS